MTDTPAAPPTTGGASTRITAEDIIARLVKRGVPQHVAEGMALNVGDESGFNPYAVGDNGNAFGLFQHNGPRMRGLKSYMESSAVNMDDANAVVDAQLDYALQELKTSERGAWKRMMATKDRGSAAVAFLKYYERPAAVHARRREAAYLGGLLPRGEYSGDTTGSFPSGTASADAVAQQERMSLIKDPANINGVDVSTVGSIPGASFVSDQERATAEAAVAEQETASFSEMTSIAFDEQWIATNILRQMGKESYAPDATFQNKGFDDNLWKEVSEGIPEEFQDNLYEAVSPDHARAIARETRTSLEQQQKLAQWGFTGVGMQLAAAVLDPVSIGVSVITEGTAAPLIYGAKIGKLGRAVRAGLLASATNVAVDSYLISQDPIGNWSDLTYSAAAGFLLGGAAGALRKSPVDDQMADAMRKVVDNNGVVTDPVASNPSFNMTLPNGNLSAARVVPDTGVPDDVQSALDIVGDAPTALMPNLRIDRVGRLKQSPNPVVRWLAERFDEDAVGNKTGAVTPASAIELRERLVRNTMVRFQKVHQPAFKAWAKEAGYGSRRLYDPAIRAEFNTLVGKAVRRPIDAADNAHVAKVASKVKAEYAEMLKVGKEHGIKGFDSLTVNDLYVNRQWNVQSMDDFIMAYNNGTTGAAKMGPLLRVIAGAITEGDYKFRNSRGDIGVTRMLQNDAEDIAEALIKSVRARKYHSSFDMEQALSGADLDSFKDMLREAGVADARIEELAAKVGPDVDARSGKIGVAKHRIVLDETFRDLDSGMAVEDFLESDIEALFGNYLDGVMGEAAYQRVFGELRIPDADGVLPAQAPSFSALKELIKKTDTRPEDDVNPELRSLEEMYKTLKGIPLEAETRYTRFARRLRGFNFLRVMGQAGVAQLAELGSILGNGGMRGMIYHMPSLRDFILKAQTGNLSKTLMDELETIYSPGMDVLSHSPHVRMDDGSDVSSRVRGGKATKMQTFDYTLNNAKQAMGVVSGMTHINRMLQRLNARVLVQRFVDEANGQKGLLSRKGISQERYEALGISMDMAERINVQLRKATTVDGLLGKKAKLLNIEQWDDVDAKNAFSNGIYRWARRSVQENSIGTMPSFMSKEMGKTIMQFRSFMLGAYTKQLLAGWRHKDWETFSTFMASMFFGGLFYVGQTHVNSIGRTDRDEWLKERLSPGSIAKASFQRAGFSTFLPMVIDTAAAPFTDEPIFAYRNTEQASDAILGNPSVDMFNKGADAIKGALKAAFNDDYEYSQQDARNTTTLIPFQNALVIRNMLAYTVGQLPKFSQ